MGKGDIKTRRGKIFRGTYGNSRRRRKKVMTVDSSETNLPDNNEIKKKDWFKPKQYLHFDKQLNKKDKTWVKKIVEDEKRIAKHNFYPLIHRVIKQRRYKKIETLCGTYIYRTHYDRQRYESTTKTRHIFYGNHLDCAIYSYYAKEILSPLYEESLDFNGISDCISAYRNIETTGGKGKNNIHFAKDVFDYIKNQDESIAIALDITGFFDNLSHEHIYKSWLDILNTGDSSLPDDHERLYKSLTQFSFVEENAMFYEFGLIKIKNRKKRYKKAQELGGFYKGKTRKERNRNFRYQVCRKGNLKSHFAYEVIVRGSKKGIPQGLPISAFLANLYLLEFDKKVNEEINRIGGLYRRYSDDIILVCNPEHEAHIKEFVRDLICSKPFSLEIKKEKSKTTHYKRNIEGTLDIIKGAPLEYLGFDFNGKNVLLKSSALSKYHRRKKNFVKQMVKRTKEFSDYKGSEQKIWTSIIKEKYTDKGNRNFISYADRAADIMEEDKINHQVRKHKKQLNRYINKKR